MPLASLEYSIDIFGSGDRDEFISPAEYGAMLSLKLQLVAAPFSDRLLLICLFCRGLDIQDTLLTLSRNKNWCAKHGYEVRMLKTSFSFSLASSRLSALNSVQLNEAPHHEILETRLESTHFLLWNPRKLDQNGREILYLYPGRIVMREYSPEEIRETLLRNFHKVAEAETIATHRNGMLVVVDLKNFSVVRNVQYRILKEIRTLMQNIFPARIKHILIVNSPVMVKILMFLARFTLPKKLAERIKILPTEQDLRSYISEGSLLQRYGGVLPDPAARCPGVPCPLLASG